jgi:hypothetical protein
LGERAAAAEAAWLLLTDDIGPSRDASVRPISLMGCGTDADEEVPTSVRNVGIMRVGGGDAMLHLVGCRMSR